MKWCRVNRTSNLILSTCVCSCIIKTTSKDLADERADGAISLFVLYGCFPVIDSAVFVL